MMILKRFFKIVGGSVFAYFPFFVVSLLLLSIPAGYLLGIEKSSFSASMFEWALLQSVIISALCCVVVNCVNKTSKWFFLFFFGVLFCVDTYAHFYFDQRMSPLILSLILQTDIHEAYNFIQTFILNRTTSICLLLFAVLLCIYISIEHYWQKFFYLNCKSIKLMGLVVCLLSMWSIYATISVFSRGLDSNSSLNTLGQFAYSFYQVNKHRSSINDIYEANNQIVITRYPDSSPIIVCVVGESFIKRHSSLYGYMLPTNPYLEKEKEDGNLFVFTDVVSPFPSTNSSMEMFYSIKSARDSTVWSTQPLFPAVFKKAGFKVSLIDFQFARSRSGFMFDYHCTYFINSAKVHNQCFNFRNDTIFQVDGDGLDQYINNLYHSKKSLNIIHLQGQHIPPSAHFPQTKEWLYFTYDGIKRQE